MKKYSLLQRLNCLSSNKKNKHAFSLVELTVVIAIVAIISVLVTANLSFFDSTLIKLELQKLHTVCHYLRRRAMATNTIQTLQFDLQNNAYMYNDAHEKCSSSVRINFLSNIKGPPSAPTYLITKPITFKQNKIIFYPSGIVSAGTIYLTDTRNHYQYALSVPIAPISYIRMYRYDKKWKLVS